MQLHVTRSHGYPDSKGQFDGMLGMLQRGEVQLGITSVAMLPQRFEIVDFTGPTWKFRLVSISGSPNKPKKVCLIENVIHRPTTYNNVVFD
jgi:hypothetical protein